MGRRVLGAGAVALAGALAVSFGGGAVARAGDDGATEGGCEAWLVDYALNASVTISDTRFGAGDGTYPNGPGAVTVRFDDRGGKAGGNAKLVEYRMNDTFTVTSHGLFWEAKVTADSVSRTTRGASGYAAAGVVEGRSLRWTTPWSGMRTDGSLLCAGALCGKFGAPPTGRSELHVAPHPVNFSPFEYGPDFKTFTMTYSIASQQASPSQTSRIRLAGREIKRACVPEP